MKLILGVGVLILLGCGSNEGKPVRPKGEPSAVWLGGSDGGRWVVCKEKTREMVNCAIFDDKGQLESSNFYYSKVDAPPELVDMPDLMADYIGVIVDGKEFEAIRLKNGQLLYSTTAMAHD